MSTKVMKKQMLLLPLLCILNCVVSAADSGEIYTGSVSKIGIWQGGALNLEQAKPLSKQPNFKKLGDADSSEFSGCSTLPEPIFERVACRNPAPSGAGLGGLSVQSGGLCPRSLAQEESPSLEEGVLQSRAVYYSVVPFLDILENTPPEKYSQDYILQIDASLRKKSEKIRIITYNILFDLFDDQLKDKSYCWTQRLPNILTCIENMHPDIICFQEAYPTQLEDLKRSLNTRFTSFVGKSTQGELNAIFYRKDRFELDTKNYRVKTLDVSSASLELPLNLKDDSLVAKIPNFLPPNLEPGKQLTLAHFYDLLTGKNFVVINTHLTYHRINSREDQALFIENLVQNLHTLQKPVIVSGDFNSFPNRPDRMKLPFYDGDRVCQILRRNLRDTKEAALLGHIGPTTTTLPDFFSRENKAFENSEDSDVILDHIFVSPGITVLINATESAQINNRFPSDHMPVIADILLP
jgi:endonuclease/exonuclease/phosphatase family metal-dependent hydrolase